MPDASVQAQPVVLVTGCSSGIGRAVAKEFHKRGCRVVATARRLASIADLGELGLLTAEVDVCKPESLAKAVKEHGPIDIAVANAGGAEFSPLLEHSVERVRSVFDANVFGMLSTVQAVAHSMVQRRAGTIVVIGSVSGALVTPYAGAYCASKAAVDAMCAALRMELKPFGVHVLHMVTAAVKSNFGEAALAKAALPPGSVYAPIQSYIDNRCRLSQQGSMSPEEYARRLCDGALDPAKPAELLVGGRALRYLIYGRWVPKGYAAAKFSEALGLHTLGGPAGAQSSMPWKAVCLVAVCLVASVALGSVPWARR